MKVNRESHIVFRDIAAVSQRRIDRLGLPPGFGRVVGQTNSVMVFERSTAVACVDFVLTIFENTKIFGIKLYSKIS